VQDVVIWHEKLGMSPNTILREFPTITKADIYAALAYYWDHREEIEERIEAGEAFAEEMRRLAPSLLSTIPIHSRMKPVEKRWPGSLTGPAIYTPTASNARTP
jgi:hypothetical protein